VLPIAFGPFKDPELRLGPQLHAELVSGLSPEISQAMVLLGVDLPGAQTFTALEGALAAAIGLDQDAARHGAGQRT